MANELSLSFSINFSKSGAQFTKAPTDTADVSGTKYATGNPTIPTSDTTLSKGGVGTIGYVILHNLDDTNFVTFGSDGSVYPIKLKPGEYALLRWNGTNVRAKADTGSVAVEYAIIED